MRFSILAAGLALVAAVPAAATVFTFTVTNTQPANPTSPSYISSYTFSIDDATAVFVAGSDTTTIRAVSTTAHRPIFGDEVYDSDYTFYDASADGGFQSIDGIYYSAALYSGSNASPTFLPNTYDLFDFPGDPAPIASLTITSNATAAVPEPASWAMMIGGFGLVGGALRRRRVTVTFA